MDPPVDRALTELYEQTSAHVYGFLLHRCGDPTLAADVISEVYVAATRSMKEGRGETVTSSWLLTVAPRRLIDQWRRRTTRRNTLDALRRERPAQEPEGHDPARVERALASLAPKQRLALTLRYLDDLSVAEVADAVGLTYSATESLLARARRSFETAWEATS